MVEAAECEDGMKRRQSKARHIRADRASLGRMVALNELVPGRRDPGGAGPGEAGSDPKLGCIESLC